MQPVPSAQPWQQYVSPSCVYPSPGHSFLTVLQPGHPGNGIEFTNEPLSSISVSIRFLSIWWTAFHKIEIDSNGTFAWLVRACANQLAQPSPYRRWSICGITLTTNSH